jgi:hypothetical protein
LWRPSKADSFLFLTSECPVAALFIAHSDDSSKSYFHIFPCGISAVPEFRPDSEPGKSAIPASVGYGVRGPSGPRTGNSSGILPGNSSGRGGSPGSRIGGGTSGRGFPGGRSCGGSDGCPGLIGGSSCGSIGISFFPELPHCCINGAATAMFPQVSAASHCRTNSVLLRVLPLSA